MPIAANVVRMPVQRSLSPMTSVPKRIITSCSSAPRNQKYEMPITVSHSTRLPRRRAMPVTISRHGLRAIACTR